ncbi:MAG: VOC family protein [Candidatus Pacebacteria bacterium]|nr:VOC family protein [Candidatus Paceibacterota bacterium]
MKPIEIAFVIYAVSDLKKGRDFYERVLGLTPASVWSEDGITGMIEYEMGSHTLAIGKGAPSFNPGPNGAAVALEVEDFDSAAKALKDSGVKFLVEPTETPVCHMAVFQDPDGNNLMIHKRKNK